MLAKVKQTKIWCMAAALFTVFLLIIPSLAKPDTAGDTIVAFEEDMEVYHQTVAFGTAADDLVWPESLSAVVQLSEETAEMTFEEGEITDGERNGVVMDIPVTFHCEDYQPDIPGTYQFTAGVEGMISLTELPVAEVHVLPPVEEPQTETEVESETEIIAEEESGMETGQMPEDDSESENETEQEEMPENQEEEETGLPQEELLPEEPQEECLEIAGFCGNTIGNQLIRLIVPAGTTFGQIGLPSEAGAVMADGSYANIPVSWEPVDSFSSGAGQYRFQMIISSEYSYLEQAPYAVVIVGPDPLGFR